jgi:hypothetical protein
VNEPELKPLSITVDYYEAYYETGHSFQAADSVHSNISTKIKDSKFIYDSFMNI